MKMTLGKRSKIADLGLYEAKSLSSVKLTEVFLSHKQWHTEKWLC